MGREICATEDRVVRKHHLKGWVGLPLCGGLLHATRHHVAALLLVVTQEMEVIARLIDALDVGRGAESDERAGDVPVVVDAF